MDFDWIENNILLHTLDDGERKLIKEVFDIVEFEVGDDLITQGNNEKEMYIIRSGIAAVTYSQGERKLHLGCAESGAIVGEMSFFRDQPAAATITAMSSVHAYKMDRQSYCKLLVVNQEMLINLFSHIQLHTANALDASNQQLAAILMGIRPK